MTQDKADRHAVALERAQKNSNAYNPTSHIAAIHTGTLDDDAPEETIYGSVTSKINSKDSNLAATNNNTSSRKKCGETLHSHKSCPAKEAQCHHYDIVGHYSKVCHQRLRGSKAKKYTAALYKPSLLAIPENLKNSATSCTIYEQNFSALIDSCSLDSYINGKAANKLDITIQSCNQDADLASTDKPAQPKTMCTIDIELHRNKHQSVVVGVMEHQCSDLILGQDFQQRHGTLVIEYGGPLPALKVGKC